MIFFKIKVTDVQEETCLTKDGVKLPLAGVAASATQTALGLWCLLHYYTSKSLIIIL